MNNQNEIEETRYTDYTYNKEIIDFIMAYNPNYEKGELHEMGKEDIKELAQETLDNFY